MDTSKGLNKFRKTIDAEGLSAHQKLKRIRQLFNLLIAAVTEETKVQFTSQFARLSFLITSKLISKEESYILHSFRKRSHSPSDPSSDTQLGILAVDILRSYIYQEDVELDAVSQVYRKLIRDRPDVHLSFVREVKAMILSISMDEQKATARIQDEPYEVVTLDFSRPDRNEDYTDQLALVEGYNLLPLVVNLIDVEIDDAGYYYPSSIVMEPDYMYDVTSVAECFGAFANNQAGYLLRRFLKRQITKPILIGNMANYFLDQMVYNSDRSFKDFIANIFSSDPLSISLLKDQEVKEMLVLLENHFNHIKEVVENRFEGLGITKERCHVEPSFYSAKYGLQGRLDLFSHDDERANIIELKSGSAFRPNSYGLANNHYHQTLLYDMIIESVFGVNLKRNNFILYSKEDKEQLRYAPALRSEQREAIKERNLLYLHDRVLLESDDFIVYYKDYYKKHRHAIKGFQKQHFETFIKDMDQLDEIERAYVSELLQVTMRELYINKLGDPGKDKSSGLASLWLQDIDTKRDQYNILDFLSVRDIDNSDNATKLLLDYSDRSNRLSNFRVGDLGVLYPVLPSEDGVLRSQVFKVTVLRLDEEAILVRLRSKQENEQVFHAYEFWHVEHDTLDSGYNEMSRSIYEFIRAPKRTRDLLLGRVTPERYEVYTSSCGQHLTDEQQQIFQEIISSKDYYMLWGPPGTGKTSVMLREIANHYIVHERDRVILLAYTNRAVDEICEALYSLNPRPSFIRIGSRYSTGAKFLPHLLEERISDITRRQDLRDILLKEQVYVGTIASVLGKVSLFELIKFDVAIIDEASQLLESSLIGLLTRFRKWILIGDHRQLPAVIRQDDRSTSVKQDGLLGPLGIENLSTSFFERLYKKALHEKWDHSIGQLSYQGRMHKDIMSFVNQYFYNGTLNLIPAISRLVAPSDDQPLLHTDRLLYINSEVDLTSDSIKVNQDEAIKVAQLCKKLVDIYIVRGIDITTQSIGVITPYRAQIAAVNSCLSEVLGNYKSMITVDTVERYQGGARDIIIMSACMNYSFQLRSLVSLSSEGIDRKLNVAITRAKEQFILVGNKAVLCQDETYEALVDSCTSYTI